MSRKHRDDWKLRLLPPLITLGCHATDAGSAGSAAYDPPLATPAVTIDGEGWETPVGAEPDPLPAAAYPIPAGFSERDRFVSHAQACTTVVAELVPQRWRRAVLLWCDHRSYHASRNQIVVSQVDGSQIHDRDRPTAHVFHQLGITGGWLDPACPFHRVAPLDRTSSRGPGRHPAECRKLARDWPFKRPAMTERMRNQWLRNSHDYERFGARGPHDWNANAYRYLPGCWDPAQLDRFDVSITVTVVHAIEICERAGVCSVATIKEAW